MKKLLIVSILLCGVLFPSASFAEWTEVGVNERATFYVDFEGIRKEGEYVYYWDLLDLLEPTEDGTMSYKVYNQVGCGRLRVRRLDFIAYKEPKGSGDSASIPPPDEEWIYPSPSSIGETALRRVCNHVIEWRKVGTVSERTFYVDFGSIRKQGKFIYYWQLLDYMEPDEDGDISVKVHVRGDCKGLRYKFLDFIGYKEPMGSGVGVSVPPPDEEWIYPSLNSIVKQF